MLTWFAGKNIPLILQSAYTPDLEPVDLWLFSKIKTSLRDNSFDTLKDIKPMRKGCTLENTKTGFLSLFPETAGVVKQVCMF